MRERKGVCEIQTRKEAKKKKGKKSVCTSRPLTNSGNVSGSIWGTVEELD